ncbi:MAG: SMC-Scp complex subunit ScpB [Rhodospirillaceae bacterium]
MTNIDTDTFSAPALDEELETHVLSAAPESRDEDLADDEAVDEDDDDLDDEDSDEDEDSDDDADEEDGEEADEEDEDAEQMNGDDEDEEEDEEQVQADESGALPVMPEAVAEQVAEQDADRRARMAEELRVLEALLFASSEPVTERAIAERLGEKADIPALLEDLKRYYEGRGVELLQANGRWSFRTAPDVTERLRLEKLVPRKLSRAAIETLAIVAYHQPVTRAEIEEIRGVVVSTGTVDILLEEGWIKPRGRKQVPGRPVMWGTSNAFLDHFGLESIQDLPGIDELRAAGLLDSRGGMAYATRGSDTLLFDTDESDEALEPLMSGDEGDAGGDAGPEPAEDEDKNA